VRTGYGNRFVPGDLCAGNDESLRISMSTSEVRAAARYGAAASFCVCQWEIFTSRILQKVLRPVGRCAIMNLPTGR
jgi:hypothetical protein